MVLGVKLTVGLGEFLPNGLRVDGLKWGELFIQVLKSRLIKTSFIYEKSVSFMI